MPIILLLLWFAPQEHPQPLPELKPFLADLRKTLHPDDTLLRQYTYTERSTHIQIGADGKPKKTEVEVYEITREAKSGQVYRRLISKNDVPVSAKPEKVGQPRPSRRDEEKIIDDALGAYDIRIVGRESIDGRPAIRLTFKPRPNYKPLTREGRFMRYLAGEVWVNESDHTLVRIDAEMIDTFSLGFGLLAKLQKGARVHVERRKINDEVWLPARTEVSLNARLLLLKGFNLREIVEYSDYKKFNVDTVITFPEAEKP